MEPFQMEKKSCQEHCFCFHCVLACIVQHIYMLVIVIPNWLAWNRNRHVRYWIQKFICLFYWGFTLYSRINDGSQHYLRWYSAGGTHNHSLVAVRPSHKWPEMKLAGAGFEPTATALMKGSWANMYLRANLLIHKDPWIQRYINCNVMYKTTLWHFLTMWIVLLVWKFVIVA